MNPIDQIRKALEAGPTEGPWIVMHRSSVGEYDFEVADVDHQRVVREDGMRPAVKLGTQPTDAAFIAACNPVAIAALLVSHDAAVQRAARYDWLLANCSVGDRLDGITEIAVDLSAAPPDDVGDLDESIAAAIRAIKE